MNNRCITGLFLFLAVGGTTAACGGSNDASFGSSGNGNSTSGGDSSAGSHAGGTHNATGGTGNGGTLNATGGTDAGGTDAGGTDAGGSDAGGSAGTIAAGGSGPTRPSTFPLLVAATNDTVKVWQNADVAKSGDPPTFELAVELGDKGLITGVVATRERVGVVSSEGIFLFDELGTLSASSKPTASIPPTAFSDELRGGTFAHEFVDAAGDLWLTYGQGRIALLKDFNALTASSKPKAEFTHQWGQIASAAYYAPDDILFGAQVSGAGLLYYSKAKTKTGITAPDGTFNSISGRESAVLGNSLFVAGGKLGVWHGLNADSSSRAPDAAPSGSGLYLDASANAVVIATGDGNVNYFALASSLSSDSKHDTLHVAPLLHGIDLSDDARNLATVGNDQVYVIDHGSSGLSVRAALPLGKDAGADAAPWCHDVVLVE